MFQGIKVRDLVETTSRGFDLEAFSGQDALDNRITVADVNRPGLALAGFFDYFAYERIQIIGRTELTYFLRLDNAQRKHVVSKFSRLEIPCFLFTRGMKPPEEFVEMSEKTNIPLLVTRHTTTKIMSDVIIYLEDRFAPETSVHGVLVDVFGTGILLLGKAGIGKSESALELVERNHALVADDIVDIKRKPGNILIGSGSGLIRHHMEIRGLGIINIRELYGAGAVRKNKRISMVITLEEWQTGKEYERLGIDEKMYNILGVKLPHYLIPVRSGRNIVIICEVAALNMRLKQMGCHSAKKFNQRLINWMQTREEADKYEFDELE